MIYDTEYCQWCDSEYHSSKLHPGTCGNCGGPKKKRLAQRSIRLEACSSEFIPQFNPASAAWEDYHNNLALVDLVDQGIISADEARRQLINWRV